MLLPPGWRDHPGRGDAQHLSSSVICSSQPSKPCAPPPSYAPGILPSAFTGKVGKPGQLGLHSVTAHLCLSVSCYRVPTHREKYRAEYRGQDTDLTLWGRYNNLKGGLWLLWISSHLPHVREVTEGFCPKPYLSEAPPCSENVSITLHGQP